MGSRCALDRSSFRCVAAELLSPPFLRFRQQIHVGIIYLFHLIASGGFQ
jgi:hypothetical protein